VSYELVVVAGGLNFFSNTFPSIEFLFFMEKGMSWEDSLQ